MRYDLRGVEVEFPFEAYPCQLAYMDKVIECLQMVCLALLTLSPSLPYNPCFSSVLFLGVCVCMRVTGLLSEGQCFVGEPDGDRQNDEPSLRHFGLETFLHRQTALRSIPRCTSSFFSTPLTVGSGRRTVFNHNTPRWLFSPSSYALCVCVFLPLTF